MTVLVTGAGGFIGGHLVRRLLDEGVEVRAVDQKPLNDWWQVADDARNWAGCDLRDPVAAKRSCAGVERVYDLACRMGGIFDIERHRADCMFSVGITLNMITAALDAGVERAFLASSACVYPAGRQDAMDLPALKESDAWPAEPERGYGLTKLAGEEMYLLAAEDYPIETRIARYHNIAGPFGTWTGGKEKAPAALCRRVAEAAQSGDHRIRIAGDGLQQRSFCWVGDCVAGTIKIMESDYPQPLNLGSSEMVTINQLVDIIEETAGIKLSREYDTSLPQGVRGRNSDNGLIREVLDGWEPSTPLREVIEQLYPWIYDRVKAAQ